MGLILDNKYLDGFEACFQGQLLTKNSIYEKVYRAWELGSEDDRQEIYSQYPEFLVAWGKVKKKREDAGLFREFKQKHPDRIPVFDRPNRLPDYEFSNALEIDSSMPNKISARRALEIAQKRLDLAVEKDDIVLARKWLAIKEFYLAPQRRGITVK